MKMPDEVLTFGWIMQFQTAEAIHPDFITSKRTTKRQKFFFSAMLLTTFLPEQLSFFIQQHF